MLKLAGSRERNSPKLIFAVILNDGKRKEH